MTGHEFLVLAGRMVAVSHPTEAACRTTISRAYYGAFHIASRLLRDLGVQVGDRHAAVWRLLQVSGHEAVRDAGNALCALYGERLQADYRLDDLEGVAVADARFCVEKAHEIAALLEAFDTARDDIRRNIEAYLQKLGGRLP